MALYNILLVEDNPGDVNLIEESLRANEVPYRLTHCDTVDSAIKTINQYHPNNTDLPDLILLDYNLPGGEATAVIAAAIANPALKDTVKAVITSSVSPRDRQNALRTGADCFIYKPVDLDSFLNDVGQSITKLLAESRRRQTA